MKWCRKILLAFGAVAAAALSAYVINVCTHPMTDCLTFDDGLKAHATIASPALLRNGWHGMFAIVTESDHAKHPVFSKYQMATRDEVRSLCEAGHLVVPHTVTHPNLKVLSEAGQREKVDFEIKDSQHSIIEITGVRPKYFVFPYNSWNPQISAVIRGLGMIPVEGGRPDFGENCTKYQTGEDIQAYLTNSIRYGSTHEDLMIHGIGSGGGWRAFTVESFDRFLSVLKKFEDEGKIRVVDFDAAHENGSAFDWLGKLHRKISAKIRRQVYKRIYD